MMQRLQKILAGRGLCSRREAETWIAAGRVTVDGQTARVGDSADPEQAVILLDGRPLPAPEKRVYLMLNKPRGCVTTLSDEKGRPTAAELVSGCGVRVYPVGRLDMDSEGLLLFTSDGAFANRLTHPRHQVEKGYEVWVRGYTPGAEALLRRSIVLDGRAIAPPEAAVLWAKGTRARLAVTIHEGRNRQVRRMCQAAGLEVERLRRVREGSLELGNLPAGAWRYLTEEEVAALEKESFPKGTCKTGPGLVR